MENRGMTDIDQTIRRLYLSQPLREPVIKSAIEASRLPSGSCGLDVGCGIGLNTLMLAEAVGNGGQVIGLDITKEFLDKAHSLAAKSAYRDRLSFRKGDAGNLSFAENTFDWAFSTDFVGCAPIDPLLLLKELGRVVKPGGTVSILSWTSQLLLPGFPILEARLNATTAGIAPFETAMDPAQHFLRALSWFSQAGLIEPAAKTFVRDISAPLSPEIRKALSELFQMRWGEVNYEVSPEDWAEYQRLCREDSPDFILDLPDYYAFITYSLFWGKVI